MSKNSENIFERRASRYAEFCGILIGVCMAITVLIIALAIDKIPESVKYNYTLAAFVYSALAFINTYTWYGRATEESESQNRAFLCGTFFYYTGYWSLLLGLVYLTSLIPFSEQLNYPFLIALIFLGYTFVINCYEFLWLIMNGSKTTGTLFLTLLIITIAISYLTI